MAKVRVNWGRLPEGSEVRLYGVYNSSHKTIHVLAQDKKTAMSIACTANHVYDPAPKQELDYGRDAYEIVKSDMLPDFWNGIQVAIGERLQGTVHFEDGKLSVGDEVITK